MVETDEDLKKEVGTVGLSANLVNTIVGAGIFALPAIIASNLGPASVLAYIFCGTLIGLVMFCFAEIGSKIASSGGAYTYIRTAFGPFFGFVTAILFIMAIVAADAAVANAIADVLASVLPVFEIAPVRILLFLVFFSGFALINVRGVKDGITTVKIITMVKLLPLLLLVLVSWGDVESDNLRIAAMPTLEEVARVSLILFFAFQGAESGLSISGEVSEPGKTIPRAILIGIVGVLVLYVLIQTVAIGVLGETLSDFRGNPLGAVANRVMGPVGFTIMTIGAAISMIGYLSSSILSMPRVLFRAAKDGAVPINALTRVHPRFKTPYISISAFAIGGFLLASLGGFEQLAILSSSTVLLIYLGVSLSVIKLRRTEGHSDRKINPGPENFKIPGGYFVPLLSSLIILYLLSNLEAIEFYVLTGSVVLLAILYFTKQLWPGRA